MDDDARAAMLDSMLDTAMQRGEDGEVTPVAQLQLDAMGDALADHAAADEPADHESK